MNILYLDLTNSTTPSWWPEDTPKAIPITAGRYRCDYEVVEHLMPVGWKVRFAMAVKSRGKQPGVSMVNPVGFYRSMLPLNSRIIE